MQRLFALGLVATLVAGCSSSPDQPAPADGGAATAHPQNPYASGGSADDDDGGVIADGASPIPDADPGFDANPYAPPGSTCNGDSDCPKGDVCAPTFGAITDGENTAPLACTKSYASCAVAACGPDEFCASNPSLRADPLTCLPRSKSGASCAHSGDFEINACEDGSYCNNDFQHPTCVPQVAANGACPTSGELTSFSCVDGQSCSVAGICSTPAELGASCSTAPCDRGLFCATDSTCHTRVAAGGDCTGDTSECAIGASCQPKNTSSACFVDGQCYDMATDTPGFCCNTPSGGRCSTTKPATCAPVPAECITSA